MKLIQINETLWVAPTVIASARVEWNGCEEDSSDVVAVTILGSKQPVRLTRGGKDRWLYSEAEAVLVAFRAEIAEANQPWLIRTARAIYRWCQERRVPGRVR